MDKNEPKKHNYLYSIEGNIKLDHGRWDTFSDHPMLFGLHQQPVSSECLYKDLDQNYESKNTFIEEFPRRSQSECHNVDIILSCQE